MKKTTLLMTAALLCLAFAACEREENDLKPLRRKSTTVDKNIFYVIEQ